MLPPGSAAQGVQIRLQKEAPRALTLLGRSNITQRGGPKAFYSHLLTSGAA